MINVCLNWKPVWVYKCLSSTVIPRPTEDQFYSTVLNTLKFVYIAIWKSIEQGVSIVQMGHDKATDKYLGCILSQILPYVLYPQQALHGSFTLNSDMMLEGEMLINMCTQ